MPAAIEDVLPSAPIAAAVDVRHLEKRFLVDDREVLALRGIELAVRPGEFLAIVGGSGCGKSTLLRIIAGLESASAGTALVDGRPVAGPGLDRGMMFQDHRLLPWLTVRANLDFTLNRHTAAERRELIDRHLALVGLEGFAEAYPHQLSGGMAQRAAIARVLVNRPRVLLLDEPFGALDALTRIQMQQELLRLWEAERITVVLVTHDIDEAVFLGDRVAVMTNRPGSVREVVPVGLPRPRERSGAGFVQARKRLYEAFFAAAGPTAREDYTI